MEGQKKLKAAKVLLVGTGGLGAPLGLYLAAAGIGHDRPRGFRRGRLHQPAAPGDPLHQGRRPQEDRFRRREDDGASIRNVEIDKHEVALTSENALDILKDYDLVVDGTDNFPTRYLVNDACVLLGKPNVYGSIFRFEGQATVFAYEGGPCYRCLYPEPPPPGLVPSCAEGGVLGILPGTIGLIQATEDREADSRNRRTAGGTAAAVRRARHAVPRAEAAQESGVPRLRRSPDNHQADRLPSILRGAATGAASNPEQETKVNEGEIDVTEVKEKLDRGDNFVLIDVREPHEYQICNIPAAKLIPLGEVPQARGRIRPRGRYRDPLQERHAQRQGLRHPAARGFQHVRNMKGGILAWSDKVDPSVPKY